MIYPPLHKLRTFVAVAQHGSFRKAADQLHLSQPALSAHIRDLEELLQVPLFHRTTRSVALTSDGERLLISARRALDELESVLLELRDQVALLRGRIVISCLPTFAYHLLPKVIASFVKKHPDVDIHVLDELNEPLLRRVKSREADFGIGPRPEPDVDLQFIPLMSDPYVAVVPRTHPLASRTSVTLKALAKLPILTLAHGTNVRTQLDQVFEEQGLELKPVRETTHRATLSALVEADLGIALLPALVQSMLVSPSLTTVKIVEPEIAREFGIIQRRDQAHRPAVSTFLAALKTILGSASEPARKKAIKIPQKTGSKYSAKKR